MGISTGTMTMAEKKAVFKYINKLIQEYIK